MAEQWSGARTLARVAQTFQVLVFVAWSYPGLYHLAIHVLHVKGHLGLPGGHQLERAHLFPMGVDGGIVTAFVLLISDRGELAKAHRRELWAGMWACAGLSSTGLVVDAVKAGAGWASPLVVIPVALGTWFLHMVVERRGDSAAAAGAEAAPARDGEADTFGQPPEDDLDDGHLDSEEPEPEAEPPPPLRPPFKATERGPCDCGCGRSDVPYRTWWRHHPELTAASA